MFSTGFFKIDATGITMGQRFHDKEVYDDDPMKWNENTKWEEYDGYISNVGTVITIHVRRGMEDCVDRVKKIAVHQGKGDKYTVQTVVIE